MFGTVCRQVQVYAASGEQPALERMHNELTDAEKEVDLFFSNQNNVDRLIEYLALEEKKGKDKFNGYRFIMFKVLCRSTCYLVLIVIAAIGSLLCLICVCTEAVIY
jgi:hypothetical protein